MDASFDAVSALKSRNLPASACCNSAMMSAPLLNLPNLHSSHSAGEQTNSTCIQGASAVYIHTPINQPQLRQRLPPSTNATPTGATPSDVHTVLYHSRTGRSADSELWVSAGPYVSRASNSSSSCLAHCLSQNTDGLLSLNIAATVRLAVHLSRHMQAFINPFCKYSLMRALHKTLHSTDLRTKPSCGLLLFLFLF